MKKRKQLNLDVNLNYLICSLYTLSEYNHVFKKLVLKNAISWGTNNKNHSLNNVGNFNDIYKLLESAALRRFSVILLYPLLKKGLISYAGIKKNTMFDADTYNEMFLLKRYLRKFSYNYLKYFQNQNENANPIFNQKDLNTEALKILFLLAGI